MATQSVKDILDTEIPKPSFVLSPSVPAPLPSGVTVTRNGQDNVARTLDPYSGKFEHVPEDTPRVYGSDQSLLVEAAERTNYVQHSANLTFGWDAVNAAKDSRTSIFKGPDANAMLVNPSSDSINSGLIQRSAGVFSSSVETASYIYEPIGNLTSLRIRDANFNNQGRAIYNPTEDFTATSGDIIDANTRKLADVGPNGNPVYRTVFRYDPTVGTDFSGNRRRAFYLADVSGGSQNASILHHAQIEEARNASSPIVTGSSAKTRAGDDYKIFDYSNDPDQDHPEWYNANQGTVFIELEELNNNGFYSLTTGTFRITTNRLNWFFTTGGNNISVGESSLKAKIAASFNSTERVLSVNGTSNTQSTTQISHFDSSIFYFGDIPSNLIKRFVYYPRALPESTLNTLTS